MRDFLGNEITPGCWLAFPGAGNKSNEHGLILLWVERVTNSRVYIRRLTSRNTYDRSTHQRAQKASIKETYICNTQKCVVVQPPENVKALFALTAANELTFDQQYQIGQWLTGQSGAIFDV